MLCSCKNYRMPRIFCVRVPFCAFSGAVIMVCFVSKGNFCVFSEFSSKKYFSDREKIQTLSRLL